MVNGKNWWKNRVQNFQGLTLMLAVILLFGAAVFAPNSVSAASKCPDLAPGKLMKVNGKNLYYQVGAEGELKKFASAEALLTWHPNYAKMLAVKAECLKDKTMGGMIGYRPGSRIVKYEKKFYAVGPNKTLHELATPAIAKSIYGANWKAYSRNISKEVFSGYTVGAALTAGVLHDGMLVRKAGSKIVYFVMNGQLTKVKGTLSAAARNDVRSLNAKSFAALTVNDAQTITAAEVIANAGMASMIAPKPSASLIPLPSGMPTDYSSTTPTTPSASLAPLPSPGPTDSSVATSTTPVVNSVAPVDTVRGWVAYTEGLSGLGFKVFVPAADRVKSVAKDSKETRLGAGSYSLMMDSAKLEKNVDRIDLTQSVDPADTAYEIRAYAEALYTVYKNGLEGAMVDRSSPKITCAWPTPSYETKTIGGNSWVTLSFMDGCTGGKFIYPVYKQLTFAVTKVNGKMNVVFFNNSSMDVRTPGTNNLDPGRAVNAVFVDEFLSKLVF